MRAVYKYPLSGVETTIVMPVGAEIIHFALQEGAPMLWALVDPSAGVETERRVVRIVGTGDLAVDESMRHVATTLAPPFVWHLFERWRDD